MPRLSNRGIHAMSILTKYLANHCVNTFRVRAPVDPENALPHLLAPIVKLLVWDMVIPDGVETMSGICSSVYSLTAMITNYLAPVLDTRSRIR